MSQDVDESEWEAGSRRHDQALALLKAGRLAEAEAAAAEALARLEAALPGGHPDSANAADTLAAILAERGQTIPAFALWRHALTILDQYLDEELAARMRLGVLRNLGHALTLSGEYGEARVRIDEAIKESARLFGQESIAAAVSQNLLGVHYKLRGRCDEAEAAYLHACRLYEKNGRQWPAFLLHNLAGLACARGDHAQAHELSQRTIELRRETGERQAFQLGTDLAGLGDALAGLGRFADASAAYREALALYASSGRGDHPEVAYTLHNLADVLASRGQMAEALQCYRESMARKESAFGPDHHEVAASLNDLAVLQWRMGVADEAVSSSNTAAQLASRLAPDHPVRIACERIAAQLRLEQRRRG